MAAPLSAAEWRNENKRLIGRAAETDALRRLLDDVRGGQSRALVVVGEAGTGKTALLQQLADGATGCRVISVSGVQSEMELAFAALHQLCSPLLDQLSKVPAPQALALRITFGLEPGPVPDRFVVGLAVLSLLAEAAAERPVLAVVDDEQWLDRASAQLMAFVARRLGAESVGLVFGSRGASGELEGLARLTVEGLGKDDACALLDATLTVKVDQRVRDQLVLETHGNPLALVELPRELMAARLAGGFGLPGAVRVPSSAEEMFRRRSEALPDAARRLLLLAAAEPTGDPVLLGHAAQRLGIEVAVAQPLIVEAGLAEFGSRVRFRHPLARSAAYRLATVSQRQQAHAALAEATDPALDPDRHAWHRAQAAQGLDEDVAGELERSANRAQARGGLAAAAAFLERAAALTPDPALRTRRALAAAQAKVQAGEVDGVDDLLAIAQTGPMTDADRAQARLISAQRAFAASKGSGVPELLLAAAKDLEPVDPALARMTYLDAARAAIFAGRLSEPDADFRTVIRAAAAGPSSGAASGVGRLLDGLAAVYADGWAHGVPVLRGALLDYGDMSAEVETHFLSLATFAAAAVWDTELWKPLTDRYVGLCRELGALSELRVALTSRAFLLMFAGDLAGAGSAVAELQAAMDATGSSFTSYGALGIAALRGQETEVAARADVIIADAVRRGEGLRLTAAGWAVAVLNNGIGRYREALAAARRATEYPRDFAVRHWALPELVEAAVRSGEVQDAAAGCDQIAEIAEAWGSSWGLGVYARSRALLATGERADDLYRESISQLGRAGAATDLARAHLLYGEWLRRERRRGEARAQLRQAYEMLADMGMAGFADRAARELWAAGESTSRRDTERHDELTAQESQIAKLARDGLTNPEIGTRLFISARTVEYHLGKVFAKLGITSRGQLDRVLP